MSIFLKGVFLITNFLKIDILFEYKEIKQHFGPVFLLLYLIF